MHYSDLAGEEKLVHSHTALKQDKYEVLAEKFSQEWDQYRQHFTW